MLRTATLLLTCALLTACQTNTPSDVVFPAAATPAAPAVTQASPAAEPAPGAQVAAAPGEAAAKPRSQAAAGRATRATVVPEETKGEDGPLTITKAREQCWMASETDKAARTDLDKKAKFVEACVDKKMNASIGR